MDRGVWPWQSQAGVSWLDHPHHPQPSFHITQELGMTPEVRGVHIWVGGISDKNLVGKSPLTHEHKQLHLF